jgi:transposase
MRVVFCRFRRDSEAARCLKSNGLPTPKARHEEKVTNLTPKRISRTKKSTRKRHIRKRRPGQPESSYKLDLRVRAKICESILEGLTLADAAALAGVSRQTVNEWRRRGEEKPDSLYGEFSEAFELAKLQSKKGMIQKLLRHKDPRWTWKLMCNRWPEEFRDRVATEISGPNGVPLMPQNPFKVEIMLADSEEIQTDFEVEEPDGSISHVHYDPYGLERQREAHAIL